MTKSELYKYKQELKEYIHNKKWIEERLDDIKERRSLLDKITNTLSDIPKGSPKVHDTKAELLISVMDDTDKIKADIEKLRKKQIIIESRINKIAQPYKNILYFRYIKGYNLTEVSNEINKEYDYTRRLHGIALMEYARLGEIYG